MARRSVLKLGLAAGLALAPQALMAKPNEPPKPENVLSPDAALDRLMQGNGRYVEGVTRRHDFKHEREPLSRGQNPFAAVLSCADSRIAPEYCFDTARGDVFVCRLAGNFASDVIIASLEYAVAVPPTMRSFLSLTKVSRIGVAVFSFSTFAHDVAAGGVCQEIAGRVARLGHCGSKRRHEFRQVAGKRGALGDRFDRRVDCTAGLVPEHHDQRRVQHVYQLGSGRVDLIARD
jgi:hypothetical protein